MATTYTYADIMNVVSRFVSKISDSDIAATVCNIAQNEFWKRYDFRETLATLPPFYLIPNTQDYGSPLVAVPSDFLGLREAYLVHFNANPAYRMPLGCLKDLTLTTVYGLTTDIGYSPSTQSFRLFPRVPANIGSPDWCIQGVYKTKPVKVTSANMSNTFVPFDDIYLQNMIEVFKWAAWQLSGDPRAGGLQKQKDGRTMYTGQYATAMEAIDAMAENEGIELGDISIAPNEALALTYMQRGSFPWARIYGF